MAYVDDYSKTNWVNNTTPAINQSNLNHAEQGIKNNCSRVANLSTTKAEQSDLLTVFKSVSFDSATGTFTFTRFNDTVVTINTDLEKIAVNFDYDDNPNSPHYQNLIITLADGTVKYADLSALITQYEFTDTATIDITVSGTGTISASVIDGSITASKLQPNYLADVTAQASIATNGANTATSQALISEGWAKGTQNGNPVTSGSPYFENNAKYYKDQAQQIAGASLGGLSDVTITTPTNGQVLTYDADNNIWRNSDGGSVDTKSGNPVAITTDSAQVSRGTTITLNPIQAAGTPTPSNPLPISGYDNVTLSGGGNSLSLPLPETVYGGTYYAESGVLTVNRAMVDMGDLTWTKFTVAEGTLFRSAVISNGDIGITTLCTSYKTVANADRTNLTLSSGTGTMADVIDNDYSDAATFKTAVTGQKLVYELATPYDIRLNPQQIFLLEGSNTLTSNGTTITVVYKEGKLASLADVEVTNRQINNKIRPISINTEVGNPITFATDSVQTAIGTSVVLEPIQASGTPTPSNPLPISGYNNIEVKVPWGRNLLNADDYYSAYKQSDNNYVGTPQQLYSINIPVGKYVGQAITFSFRTTVNANTTYIKARGNVGGVNYDGTQNVTAGNTGVCSITLTPTTGNDYVAVSYGSGGAYQSTFSDFQLELGSTATAYSPYSLVTDINLTLPNTVYGGTYNVEAGVMTVTHGIVDMGALSWTYVAVSSSFPYGLFYATITDKKSGETNLKCTIYPHGDKTVDKSTYGNNSNGYVYVADSSYTDAAAFKTAVTGQKIVYELTTPYQIGLVPQQVLLPSTKDHGGRVMWTNGTAISMTYRKGEMASLWNTFGMGAMLNGVSKQAFEGLVSAQRISTGTFQGQVNANATAMANLGTAQVRNIIVTDTAPTVGSSTTIPDGTLIIVYE